MIQIALKKYNIFGEKYNFILHLMYHRTIPKSSKILDGGYRFSINAKNDNANEREMQRNSKKCYAH